MESAKRFETIAFLRADVPAFVFGSGDKAGNAGARRGTGWDRIREPEPGLNGSRGRNPSRRIGRAGRRRYAGAPWHFGSETSQSWSRRRLCEVGSAPLPTTSRA
jgi:hypothetical protein